MKKTILVKFLVVPVCLCMILSAYCKTTLNDDIADTDRSNSASLLTEVLDDLTSAFKYFDDISEKYNGTLNAVQSFIDSGEADSSSISSLVTDTIEYLDKAVVPTNTLASKESQFDGIGLSYLDFETAFSDLPVMRDEFKSELTVVNWYLTEYILDDRNEILGHIVTLDKTVLENEIKMQYIALNWFLIGIEEDIAASYRITELLKLQSYQREAFAWQTNETLLEEWIESAAQNIVTALEEYEKIVGKQQNELDIQEQLIRIAEKEAELEESRKQLNEALQELGDAKKRGREKFKPESSDDFAVLWNKALRFHSLKDEEYVTLCLDMFVEKAQSAGDKNFTLASARKIADAAEAFWKEARDGSREGGVMAFYFEPSNGHEFLQAADIIIKINGVPCNELDDYISNKKADSPNELTYVRFENGRFTEYKDIVPVASSVKIAGGDLIEYFE